MAGVDLLFVNADVIPMTGPAVRAGSLGVDGGRIVYVGDHAPEALRREARQVVDLRGRALVPGFIDTHVRLPVLGAFGRGVDLAPVESFDELAAAVRAYRRVNPDTTPLLGRGLCGLRLAEGRLPDRFELDRIEPEVPLFLLRYDLGAAVVSSPMLRRLGVPPSTPGFQGGPEVEDKTGLLLGDAFALGFSAALRMVAPGEVVRGIVSASNEALARGVTTMHCMDGGALLQPREIKEMRAARRAVDARLLLYHRAGWSGERPPGGAYVGSLDGALGTREAALVDPYEPTAEPSGRGRLALDQARVDRLVYRAHRRGLQSAITATGDSAIEVALTAIESALRRMPTIDHRHRIEVCALPTDQQLDRLAELGLAVSARPARLASMDEPLSVVSAHLGPERSARLYPLRRIVERGILLAGASGAPEQSVDPIRAIHEACNHPNESERLQPYDALAMFTCDAARIGFEETDKGTLTPGKRADLVVLSESPLDVPLNHLHRITAESTWLGGERHEPQSLSVARYLWGSLKGRLRDAVGLGR